MSGNFFCFVDPTILINVSILYLQTLARVIGTVVQFSEDQMKQLIAREDKNFVSNFHHEKSTDMDRQGRTERGMCIKGLVWPPL